MKKLPFSWRIKEQTWGVKRVEKRIITFLDYLQTEKYLVSKKKKSKRQFIMNKIKKYFISQKFYGSTIKQETRTP